MTESPDENGQLPVEPKIYIEPAQMAGVWANFARVSHSPYEFTLDFIRLDFSSEPRQGIVVSRVSLSPLMVTQLIEALGKNWDLFAQKSLPPEVSQYDQLPTEGDGSGTPDDPAA